VYDGGFTGFDQIWSDQGSEPGFDGSDQGFGDDSYGPEPGTFKAQSGRWFRRGRKIVVVGV